MTINLHSSLFHRSLGLAFTLLCFAFGLAACGDSESSDPAVSGVCAMCPDTCAFGRCPATGTSNNTSTSNGTTATSNGTTSTSNGTTSTSNGTTSTSNGTTATSNGTTATSNGTTSTSNGTTSTSNGTTSTSNGTTSTSNGTTSTSNGTTSTSNGTTALECVNDDECEADEFCEVQSGTCFAVCEDDGNDDDLCEAAAADPITLEINGNVSITERTACPGNTDHYSVTLETAQRLQVLVNRTGGDGELTLDLLGPDCLSVVAESEGNAQGGRTMLASASVGGTYTLRVSTSGNVVPADYQITIILLAPDACTDDVFEGNATLMDAGVIDSGPTSASLCEDDVDWYQITLFEGDTVNMTLVYDHNRSELMTAVYGPGGEGDIRDMFSRDGNTNTDQLAATPGGFTVTAANEGDWFIEIERNGNGEWIDYLLNLDIVPAGELGCVERAPNEMCSEATPLVPFADPRSAFLCGPSADEDWYAIRVAAGQELTVRTEFLHFDGNLELSLFAPGDLSQPVALSATAGPNFEEVITTTTAGEYCARVFARSEQTENNYTIQASVE